MKVIVTYKELVHKAPISFTILKGRTLMLSCTGYICLHGDNNFIAMSNYNNNIVFRTLHLDAKEFVWEITGENCMGSWPESSTPDKLEKVLEALKCFHEL